MPSYLLGLRHSLTASFSSLIDCYLAAIRFFRNTRSRKDEGRLPEITELKQRMRDVIAPGRSLGHADRKTEEGEA